MYISIHFIFLFKELREKGMLKQCDLKNLYLRDSPLDELLPKPSANDLKINIDKQQEISVNNYQKYILGYTGKVICLLYFVRLQKNLSYIKSIICNYRIYTRDAFSIW